MKIKENRIKVYYYETTNHKTNIENVNEGQIWALELHVQSEEKGSLLGLNEPHLLFIKLISLIMFRI